MLVDKPNLLNTVRLLKQASCRATEHTVKFVTSFKMFVLKNKKCLVPCKGGS